MQRPLGAAGPDTTGPGAFGPSFAESLQHNLAVQFQRYLDMSVPHLELRWIGFGVLCLLYGLRVFLLDGFFIVSYALGIYLLHLFIGFLSPQEDPDLDGLLPTSTEPDEFKPFQRRLPEFKFWYSASKSVSIGLFCTLFPILDVPVFWPILLVYFLVLLFLTLKKQIQHMIRHKYVPFSFGKKKYVSRKGTEAAPGRKLSK